jgi:hypothetical protein
MVHSFRWMQTWRVAMKKDLDSSKFRSGLGVDRENRAATIPDRSPLAGGRPDESPTFLSSGLLLARAGDAFWRHAEKIDPPEPLCLTITFALTMLKT